MSQLSKRCGEAVRSVGRSHAFVTHQHSAGIPFRFSSTTEKHPENVAARHLVNVGGSVATFTVATEHERASVVSISQPTKSLSNGSR